MTQFSIDTHDTQLLKSETRDLRPKTRILIIAGGTGGHIFPALTIAHALKKQGVVIAWLGAETGMERQLVGDQFPLFLLPVKALRGKSVLTKLIAPFRLLYTIFLAARIIQQQKPDVVLGMGGYASGPGCIAAKLLRKRLVIHEQNAIAGLTNRLLSRIANTVLAAFPNAFTQKRAVKVVGNPVRDSILQIPKKDFKTRVKPWHILILGGSQGASAINQLVSDWVMACGAQTDFTIWHQTGQRDFESIQKKYSSFPESIYRVSPFIDNMTDAYTFADIVIARSGALTVSEIAVVGLPSILIPFPHAVDDHQYKNALFLENQGAAVVCRENELNAAQLDVILRTLFFDAKKLQYMSNQAIRCASRQATQKIIQACFFKTCAPAFKKVFFIGIGGIGMSGLAELLHEHGAQVAGSDVSSNALTQRLQTLDITVFDSHDSVHVTNQGFDLVVYSSAVSPDNPERIAAKAQHIPMISRGQLLAELMQAECNIVVAGTHGKTTTTGLMTWALEKADLNPTSMIGGVLRDRESPMHLGDNHFFVAESDESDASFLFLSPTVAVFTNVGQDHMETYAHDFERLKTSFLQLANQIPFNGFAVVCIDDPVLRDLIPRMQCRVITYGESADADFQLIAFQQNELTSTFNVKISGINTCFKTVKATGCARTQQQGSHWGMGAASTSTSWRTSFETHAHAVCDQRIC